MAQSPSSFCISVASWQTFASTQGVRFVLGLFLLSALLPPGHVDSVIATSLVWPMRKQGQWGLDMCVPGGQESEGVC